MSRRRLLYHLCQEELTEESLKRDSRQSVFGAFITPSPSLTCAETLAHIRTLPAEEEPEVTVPLVKKLLMLCCHQQRTISIRFSAQPTLSQGSFGGVAETPLVENEVELEMQVNLCIKANHALRRSFSVYKPMLQSPWQQLSLPPCSTF